MRRPGQASEVDLDPQGDWQLVTDGAQIEVVHVQALPGFMPATPGDVWEYRSTQPGTPEIHSCDRVLAARREGALWIARLRSEIREHPAAQSERDLVLAPAGVLPEIGTMTSGSGPVRTLATSGLFLPAALPVGLRWRWTQRIEMAMATMDVSATAEVMAIERVTVPAGTFEAVRVHAEVATHMQLREPADAAPIEQVQRDVSHWVRGLGLVRTSGLGPPEQRRDKVLVAHDVRGAPRPLDD